MKHVILTLALALTLSLSAAPAAAQEGDAADEGLNLIQRGFSMIFRQFWDDAGPQVDDMARDLSGSVSRLAPALQDLAVLVDDFRNYQPPERLENGDIVIRRREGAPPPPPVGDGLRGLTTPDPSPVLPVDPDAPEIAL